MVAFPSSRYLSRSRTRKTLRDDTAETVATSTYPRLGHRISDITTAFHSICQPTSKMIFLKKLYFICTCQVKAQGLPKAASASKITTLNDRFPELKTDHKCYWWNQEGILNRHRNKEEGETPDKAMPGPPLFLNFRPWIKRMGKLI